MSSTLSTNVELSVRYQKSNSWLEIGRTEKVPDSLSPRWTKKFLLQYRFEERQLLRFEVYDIDSANARLSEHDPLGYIECSLGELVASQSRGFFRRLNRGGLIFVQAE